MKNLTDCVWLRSHEEEGGGGVRVYRPEDHPLPPARGREGLVFHADGRFEYLGPGRDDRPVMETGAWCSDPDEGARVTATVGGETIELRIAEVTEDMLRLEWLRR